MSVVNGFHRGRYAHFFPSQREWNLRAGQSLFHRRSSPVFSSIVICYEYGVAVRLDAFNGFTRRVLLPTSIYRTIGFLCDRRVQKYVICGVHCALRVACVVRAIYVLSVMTRRFRHVLDLYQGGG